MPKKAAPKRPTRNPATLALEAAKNDKAILRRLNGAHRDITALGRRIIANKERATGVGLEVARRLCDGTDYAVYGVHHVESLSAIRDEAIKQYEAVVAELQELKDIRDRVAK